MSDCIFCKIIKGEIPSELVYENEHVVGFKDINPEAPIHLLIVPKKHISSTMDITDNDKNIIIPEIFAGIQQLAKEFNIEQDGFRVVNNCGNYGGQTVGHLHFHLLGGRELQWPPG